MFTFKLEKKRRKDLENPKKAPTFVSQLRLRRSAEIAQLVEHDLAKVGVASSSLVFRSRKGIG